MPAIVPDIFLFFITDDSGLFYYVDENDMVQRTAIPRRLRNFPREWMDVEMKWGRSATYFGLDRTFSNSYTYYRDAARIIRNRFYQQRGIEEKLNHIIAKSNADNVFELYSRGGIDLPELDDDPAEGVTVNIIDTGVAEVIRNKANDEYSIPCNSLVQNAIRVRYDGIVLFDKFKYGIPDHDTQHVDNTTVAQTMPFSYLTNEGDYVGVQHGSQTIEDAVNLAQYVQDSNNYFFYSAQAINGAVFSVSVTLSSVGLTGNTTIRLISNKGTNIVLLNKSWLGSETISATLQATVNIQEGEKFFLVYLNSRVANAGHVHFNEAIGTLDFATRNAESTAYALRPIDLGNSLLEQMAPGKGYRLEGSILEEYRHVVVLSGDNIRGIDGAKIPTKWSDYWQFLWKLTGSALTIRQVDQRVIIEKRTYVFNTNKVLGNFGSAKRIRISPAKDMYYSRVKVGYNPQEYDERNGRYEFNSTQYYSIPLTKIDRELDLVIPYRADSYGQEFLRQEYFNKETTDTKDDNEVFILDVNDLPNEDGTYGVYRDVYDSYSGMPTNTFYNYRLSPRHILLKHLDLIGGALYNLTAETITFNKGDKNTAITTVIAGVSFTEAQGIPVADLPPSYYRPFLLEIETEMPDSISRLMADGLGEIQFQYNGFQLSGFPWEITSKPALNESQTVKLLCSSNVDPRIFEKIGESYVDLQGMGIISHKLPAHFTPDEPIIIPRYNSYSMDQRLFKDRISRYSNRRPYYQKWQTNDRVDLQYITRSAQVVLQLYNCKGQVKLTPVVNQVPSSAVTNPDVLLQASFALDTLEPGKYYLFAIFGFGAGARAFLCEGWHVKERWAGTGLIEYTNSRNERDVIWRAPFASSIRVEGMLTEFQPKSTRTSYANRNESYTTIEGIPYETYTLALGSYEDGLPDWMIRKVNAIFQLDDVRWDGMGIALVDDGEFAPTLDTQGSPLNFWKAEVRKTDNEPGIYVDADGAEDSGLTVEYDLNTIGITSPYDPNANQQDAIIKVTDVR